ncbi:cytochrome c [Massilia sp. PAMC28688]|uniref:c-type cytochrome n=1 Tax=Massilia sp. PAMC28688 TaxID=2861283 RepID=UPI001C62B303|nr:c-type cytochrome [Massilia sp. PAMC28688]QYF94085.1 cytochrome c [Massilia sp. PAMC28688]
MNRWVKGTSLVLAVLAAGALAVAVAGKYLGERKMARVITVEMAPFVMPSKAISLAQGRYLFSTRGCADCHGANGAGREIIRSGAMLVVSPAIAPGADSITNSYTATDWVRTLRHGIKPDGRPVMIMPSEDYNRLTDDDVAALISYVRRLPPVDGRAALVQLPLTVKVMYAFGYVKDAAEMINHALPPQQPVLPSVSLEHGKYVANSCIGCHGAGLSGGRIPGSPPDWPAPANLTPGPGNAMALYDTPEAFMAMLRTGNRPDGSAISKVMPFGSLKQMNDTDVRALHAYLQTLPPRPAGGR